MRGVSPDYCVYIAQPSVLGCRYVVCQHVSQNSDLNQQTYLGASQNWLLFGVPVLRFIWKSRLRSPYLSILRGSCSSCCGLRQHNHIHDRVGVNPDALGSSRSPRNYRDLRARNCQSATGETCSSQAWKANAHDQNGMKSQRYSEPRVILYVVITLCLYSPRLTLAGSSL